MKRLFALISLSLFACRPALADDGITTPYQTARSIHVYLRDQTDANKFYNSADFTSGSCASSACCKYSIDGASYASCANQPSADARKGYTFTADAAELTGCETVYTFEDQTGTKRWADKAVHFYTYGHPSACHKTPAVRRD